MLLPLTANQQQAFRAFYALFRRNKYPPTNKEVHAAVGRPVDNEIAVLIKKGWLERIPGLGARNRKPTAEAEQEARAADQYPLF